MQSPVFRDITLLLTRISVSAIFLWHGVPKALRWAGEGGAIPKFVNYGLPGFLGPVTGILEVIFGVTLLIGLFNRVSAAVLLVIILGAIVIVQIPAGIRPNLERDILIVASLCVLLSYGAGRFAITRPSDD